MVINNLTLAYLCNDLENAQDYKIIGGDCFHKGKLIGEINEEFKDDVLNIYFKPFKPVKCINVNIIIDKPQQSDSSNKWHFIHAFLPKGFCEEVDVAINYDLDNPKTAWWWDSISNFGTKDKKLIDNITHWRYK